MSVTLELPARLLARLREVSDARGASLEEVILEAACEYVKLSDPEVRAELHLALCEKYLREADELLSKGDHVQASVRAWGAAAQAVKAVASKRGVELRSHGELWRFVSRLREETGDEELGRLWHVANSLHVNFYEAWAPLELVEDAVSDVKRLVEKLKSLM